jgi:hypothetical protein
VSDIVVNLIDGDSINVSIAEPQPINVTLSPDEPIVVVTVAEQGPEGIPGANGTVILYGTGDPPSPVGLANGTLYIKHEV